MSAAWAGVAISGIGGFLAWCSFVARLLWNFRGNWDKTNSTLQQMAGQISRLAETDKALEQQLQRHLDCHDSLAQRR